jgi:eukaryotic-like serine/threonine-protein kinase
MTLPAGTRLGPYEILSPLGAGGMGEVYRARDTRLGREVAVKVLPEALASDQERLKRFEKEAKSASALNHPNIVTIHDVGSEHGISYIAMELVEGTTLRELMVGGTVPIKKLLQVASQIADGLARAHESGIVHRDLKPENAMVTKSGLVKILDFGLAKLSSTGSGSGEGSQLPTMTGTQPGVVVGTVGYMSPEQASGGAVEFRSDQFALGSILYEMAAGKRAFQRKTAVDTLAAILNEEPEPIAQINPQVPLLLRWIIERCLAKDPEERYASTQDLARDLARVRDRISEGSSGAEGILAAPARRKSPLIPLLLGAALLVLGVAAGVFLSRGLVAKGSASSARFQRLTFRRGMIHNARFAPDGQTVLYGATWAGEPQRLYVARTASPESWALGLGDGSWDILAASPSGELAVLSFPEAVLARVPMAGGIPRQVLQGVLYASADFAPNGKDLAVIHEVDHRFRLEFPIGKVLLDSTEPIGNLRLSPRGDLIAYLRDTQGTTQVGLIETSGKGNRELSSGWSIVTGVSCWRPDGREIWFTAGRQGEARAIQAVDLTGKARLVTLVPGDLELDDISKDGRVLVAHHTILGILMGRAAGDAKERDLSWLDYSVPADLSPDGKTLLFLELGQGSGSTPSVHVRKTDGSAAVRLGEGKPFAISPDGTRVLIRVDPPGSLPHLALLPTGPGETTSVTNDRFVNFDWALWLPDGKRIVFSAAEKDRPPRLYAQDLQGGKERPISPEGVALKDAAKTVSPDGKSVLAFAEKGKAFLFPIDGGDPRPVAGLNAGDRPIQWTADGRFLYVVRRDEVPIRIWVVDPATGTRKLFKEVSPAEPTQTVWYFFITPDGQSYVYGYQRALSDLYLVEGLK